MLRDLLAKRLDYAAQDGERFFDAAQNARVVADAERYYRAMYYGSRESWNLRDQHMFDTLQALLAFRGPDAKAVVWAHNSHVGDAAATEMGARGELNVGQLCRASVRRRRLPRRLRHRSRHGRRGRATGTGRWSVMRVRPAHPRQLRAALPRRRGRRRSCCTCASRAAASVRDELAAPRLERAIGVVYRPETELASHYFQAVLPAQFDEYIWFDETHAVTPLAGARPHGVPDTYPFGL